MAAEPRYVDKAFRRGYRRVAQRSYLSRKIAHGRNPHEPVSDADADLLLSEPHLCASSLRPAHAATTDTAMTTADHDAVLQHKLNRLLLERRARALPDPSDLPAVSPDSSMSDGSVASWLQRWRNTGGNTAL